jgi:hypothetical protein
MNFIKIKPYGNDAYTYWMSGIYKIVSYRKGEYLAFFIQDWAENWGDHVSPPPDNGKYGKCWATFNSAKQACKSHAARYAPALNTIDRAAHITKAWIEQARKYA